MVLAGDVGATKTELALFDFRDSKPVMIVSQKYFSRDYSSPESVIEIFLKDKNYEIEIACIGVPGPVINGRAKSTNLDWDFDEKKLSDKLKLKHFKLANDLEAMAEAVTMLDEIELMTIYKGEGKSNEGNKVLIAPGTGLGQAAIIRRNGNDIIVSSEGGHTDFAPQNEIETELLKHLEKKFGHVSYERVASGEGIVNIYEFLNEYKYSNVDERILERMRKEDIASVISEEALKKKCRLCEKVMEIFASVLGAQSGNMVLNYNATGGVYLGGGIPLKIPEVIKSKAFINSYLHKGRMKYMVGMTPVYLIMNESIALTGAALLARK